MNVLSLSYQYPSRANIKGGIFVHKLNQCLVTRGLDIDVVAPVPYVPASLATVGDWNTYRQIDRTRTLDGIPVDHPRYLAVPRVGSRSVEGALLAATVGPRILDQAQAADVIHAHTALPDGLLGRVVAARTGTPLVVTTRGSDLRDPLRSPVGRTTLEFVYRDCQTAVFASEALRCNAEPVLSTTTDTAVVHDGVDSTDLASLSDDHDGGPFEILSVGALKEYKGHQYTIRALARLRDEGANVTLTIIGGSTQYNEELRTLVADLSLEDVVSFEGRIPHKSVMRAMANCDVFVLPSWQEGFGIVYVEAMAHGRPVIGCHGEGPEDSIVDGETGYLVPKRDVTTLTDRIRTLYENPDVAERIGKAARERALDRFTYDETAARYAELYSSWA